MNHFIEAPDSTSVKQLINTALQYKANPLMDKELGVGKRLGCIFLNPSMRTRLSTQIAAKNLGMDVFVTNAGTDGWAMEFEDGVVMNGSTVEHIKDAARVFGQYFDILAVRSFPQLKKRDEDYSEHIIQSMIKHSGLPVISLESSTLHPLQSLADVITMHELSKSEKRPKVVLTWAPHIKAIPQCVANSFAQWTNAWGEADLTITHPHGYELDHAYIQDAKVEYDQQKALEGADFVYVKNWSSYHQYGQVLNLDDAWMLTSQKMQITNNAKVMHCLPVRRNIELSDEILDGATSIVTHQAANRVWSAQSVISHILQSL